MASRPHTAPAIVLERVGHTLTTGVDIGLRGCYVTEADPPFAADGMASTVLAAAGAVLTEDPEGGIARITFTDRYAADFVSPQGAVSEMVLMAGLSEKISDTIMNGELAALAA